MDLDGAAHRGRVQAQGGGVEESVPWAQPRPPTARDGHRMLTDLHAKLAPSEQRHRESAFEQARQFADITAQSGGTGPTKKSFPLKPRPDHRRVDIEVHKGLAFVPDG
jgi:hypothetical protein